MVSYYIILYRVHSRDINKVTLEHYRVLYRATPEEDKMRCAICDAKLPDNQPLHNDICSVCRNAIRQAFTYELEEDDNIQCLQDLSENY